MFDTTDLKLRYITDKNGKKTEVIMPLKEFEALIEDLEDLAIAAERKDEGTVRHDELVADLKRDGLL